MHKTARHNLIRNLVKSHKVATQEDLQKLLARRGFEATQATLSRDIREIPLVKKSGFYSGDAITLTNDAIHQILSIKVAPPNMLVVQTSPGSAASIAVAIDQHKINGVAGSVAGDDTIFVAIQSQKSLSTAKNALTKLFSGPAA